jgi:3-dehydroquinate synthase
MKHIFLYGPSGSGKSTVGKILAGNLNLPFVDVDTEIERAAGKSIPQIMADEGEPAFRDQEAATLGRICAGQAAVVALGGGALLRETSRACAEAAGEVVFLEADVATLVGRLTSGSYERPLLAGDLETKLTGLLERRKAHYQSFFRRVTTMELAPEQIAWKIQQKLGRYPIRGMGSSYDVLVEPGGLKDLGERLKERGLDGPVLVVSDANIAPLYADRALAALRTAGYQAQALVIPAGEAFKTLETVASLWRGFLEAGLDRKSTVVALGGGVVGDLAGFAAATFMRGCAWVAVPTTLLSMVDASLGGKTGFDLPEGKNLVGAFYPPRLVLADPNLLSTLPEAELRSGLAEVVKHGVIADPELFALCAQGWEAVTADLPEIVRRAIGVKALVIEQDPFEKGIRAGLNLGHTVGHAVEIVSRFELRHGEAVAIGMVAEARLAEKLGLTAGGIAPSGDFSLSGQIAAVLVGLGLPTEIPPGLPVPAILQAMKFDKKKEAHVVKFALPVRIGGVRVGVAVSDLEEVL